MAEQSTIDHRLDYSTVYIAIMEAPEHVALLSEKLDKTYSAIAREMGIGLTTLRAFMYDPAVTKTSTALSVVRWIGRQGNI